MGNIEIKSISRTQKVMGIVICFNNRTYGVAKCYYKDGRYIKKIVDHFEVNTSEKKRGYKKAFLKELKKHISSETKIVYLEEDVARFLQI